MPQLQMLRILTTSMEQVQLVLTTEREDLGGTKSTESTVR